MRGNGLRIGRWSAALAAMVAGCSVPVAPPAPQPVRAASSTGAPAVAGAAPRAAPPAEIVSDCGISRLRESMLQQVNATRAAARSCGARKMQAAPTLAWNRSLAEAAELHSVDMAVHDYFDHVGRDGRRVGQRVSAQGYRWKAVGENLAGGDGTVSRVLAGWVKSPEHCQNLMNPVYAEIGVACVRRQGSKWDNYWTMVLATKR
jgi:uncharacterized protein YkwD